MTIALTGQLTPQGLNTITIKTCLLNLIKTWNILSTLGLKKVKTSTCDIPAFVFYWKHILFHKNKIPMENSSPTLTVNLTDQNTFTQQNINEIHGHMNTWTFSFSLKYVKIFIYWMFVLVQGAWNPVALTESLVESIAPPSGSQSMIFNHRLMAPPAAPQVSGLVMQASVWIPRSTHCLSDIFGLTAEFIWK